MKHIALSFLVLFTLGCKDDESLPPSIPHATITLHVRYVVDPSYGGWAFSRSARPIIHGYAAVVPTQYAASQRHELANCATSYDTVQCDWTTLLAAMDNSRGINLKLDERFTVHNPLVHVRIPLDETLFRPQSIPGRGGRLTYWAERSL